MGLPILLFIDLCLEGGMRDGYVHGGVYFFLVGLWFGRVL